jgi:hypothetical protein
MSVGGASLRERITKNSGGYARESVFAESGEDNYRVTMSWGLYKKKGKKFHTTEQKCIKMEVQRKNGEYAEENEKKEWQWVEEKAGHRNQPELGLGVEGPLLGLAGGKDQLTHQQGRQNQPIHQYCQETALVARLGHSEISR